MQPSNGRLQASDRMTGSNPMSPGSSGDVSPFDLSGDMGDTAPGSPLSDAADGSLQDSSSGQKWDNNAEMAEQAKHEAEIENRIAELRKEGFWTPRRLAKVPEPSRPKVHWDYLCEEMQWLSADFGQERRWKRGVARKVVRMVVRHHEDLKQKEERARREEQAKLRRIATSIAKEVRQFWSNVEKVVQFKQQSRLEEKRKKALDLQLDFIVGQTEKYSDLLSQSLSETRPASKTSSSCIGSSRGTSPAPSLSVRGDEDFFPHEEDEEEEDDEETIDIEEQQDGHDAESHRLEIELLKRESEVPIDELLQSLRPENVQKLVPNHWTQEAEEDDDEFTANEDDAEDEEETIAAEEELEGQQDHMEELSELAKEGEMSLEELLKTYSELQQENHSLEDSEENEMFDQGTGSSEYGSSDSEGVEYLLKPKDESETPQHSEPKKEITDIAATAESLQPKGYTLATTQVKTTVPFLLRGELREYQHIGLEWMVTMYEKKLNGILADEMGLGKTIQTISLLAHLACDKEDWGPHLIIVPTSVILNWEMELKRWCPSFKILTYYGSQKERRLKRQGWTKVNAFHVCITSYKLVLQDHQAFRRKNWKYLILDEAQNIKNFKSQRWQSLLNFNSQRRLLLTGTPLQNSLMELWSLMHFLMPHVFQSHREFKEWFSNPLTGMIEGSQEYNEGLVRRLHKVLRPFLLRRIKADVEKQMPKKYEHVIYCRLSKRQRFLYDDFMSQATTRDTLASGHFMSVINILMQLRKVCNHPNLFDPRPIHSPFITSAICYSVPSLVLHALQHHPLQCADMARFDLINMENRTSRYESEIFLPRYKPTHSLIQEIADSPEPPPRPRPLKMKVNRMLQPVTKPDPRTLVVVNNSRHVQKPADPPLIVVPPPVPAGPQAQAPPNPVFSGVVGSLQQTVQTQVPPVVQSAPGLVSVAPSTMGTVKPVAAPTAQPVNSTPQRLILSPDMQARLPSGEVITLSQLASLGRPLQAPAVTKPLTVQLHGAKLTLAGPQIRQLGMGQVRPLQGNVLHLVSSGGQHHLLSQPAQLALIQALTQQASSPAPSAPPSALVQNSVQAQLGVQTMSLQSVPHALLAGANLPAAAVTGQAPGVVKIVVRQAARETPVSSPRPPQTPPLHLPQNIPRPLLRVLPGSLPENGTSRTGHGERAVTAVTTSSIATSPLLMVSSPKPPAPNPIGSLQNHNVAFNTEAPSAVSGVALRLLTSGTSATLQLTNHHSSSQPRPTQSPALTSSPAHSLASTGSALGQIPGLANRPPCQGVTSDLNTCAIPQKVSATDTNLNQSEGQVSFPLSNGNGFGQTTLFLPQNSTVKDHLDSVISQTPPAPLSCLSAPVPTSEHNQLLSLNSSPASPPNATPGLPKLAPSGYNFSLVPALLTNSSPCTVSSYNPVPARFLTSPVSLLTLAPLSSTNSNTASILYTHPNTISTLGASATTSQTIPLPMVQSSATLSPQCLSQPPLPASVTLVSASISLPSTSTPPCNALSALTSSSPAGHAAAAPAASTSSIMLASASAPFSSITLATQTPVALTTPNSTAEFIAPGPVAALAAPSSGPLASITLAPASTSTALPSMAMPSAGRVVAAVDALPAASLIPLAGSPAHATRSILAAPASDSFTTLVASTSAHRPLRTAPASASLPLTVIASPTPAPVAALAALTPTGDTSLATLGAPVSAPLAVLASPAPLQTLSGSISVPFSLLAASVSETLPSLVLSTQLPLVTTSVTEPALSSSRATLLPASPLPLMTGSDNIPLLSSVTLPLLSTSVPVLAAKSTFTTSPVSQTTVTASPVSQTAITASPVSQIVVAASPVSQIVVAASPVSQTAVVASPVSQTTVVASPVSQTAVVASPVSQTAVVATPVSQIVVAASPVSQIVVTASPVSQSAVAASPVAQSAVAASPVAQSAVAASPVAQSAVASSPVSQTVVTASPVAQSAVAASSVSQSAVATSPAAQSAAAASPVSQTIVPAYLVAQKAVAASPVAQTAVVASPAPQEVAASLPLPVPQAASTTSAPFTVSLAAAPGLASPQAATLPLALHQSVPAPLLSVPQAAAISLPAPQAVSLRGPAAMASSLLSIPPEVTAPPLTIPPAVATATPLPVPQAVAAVASQYTAQALVPALSAPPLLQSVSFHSLASSSVTASSCTTWAATLLPSPAAVSSISMHQPIHASAPPPLQASSEQISRPLLPSPSSSVLTTFAIPVTKPPISSSASCFDAPSPALQTSSSLQLSSNPAAASAPVSSLSFCIATSVSTTLSNVTAPVSESPPPLAASCAPVSAAEPTLSLSVASPSSVSVTLNTTMETEMLLDGDISRSTHSTGGSASVWPRRQLPPPPRSPFYLEPLEERRRRHKVERLERIFQLNEQRCGLIPVYGAEIIRFCSLPNKPVLLADPCSLPRHLRDYWLQTSGLTNCVFTPQQRLEQLAPLIERFIFAMPPVEAPRITLHTSHPPPSLLLQESLFKETLSRDLTPRTSCLHRIISNMRTQFPDLRLIQYDCGKLQTLDRLLRGLKSGGHRVLLFTQMTRMLDILEQFLNYHGHIYLRLDGSTRVEQRQVLMERFNMDKRIFCFILSTRSGGVGVNLTGADTVIFYDSDWNPTMDAQAQDRCHRIGQTRDVHIYRLVSDRTVEENILKKAQQKRMLGDMAIEGGNFTTAYFKQQTIRELFEMEDVLRRDTETRPASPERSTEDGSSGRHTNILEQALCGAEDEEDTLAASLVRAEQVADLAEFNENAPLEPEEEEPSRAEQEISALVEQLTPIERYAMYYLEASMEDVSREELKQAEEQVEAARKDLFLAKDDGQSAEERWEEECRKIRKSRALPPARSQGERPPVRMSERLRGGRATEGTDVGCPAVKETTAPVPQDVRLAEETHSLETETPAEETVSSGHENMSSEETGAPVQETESPAVQTDTPVTETVSPAEESVTPVQDAAGPCGETITPSPKKVQDTARSLVDQSLPPKTDLPEPDPMVKSEDDSRVLEEYSSSPPALPQQEVLELQGFLDMEECQREVLKEEEKLIVPKHETSLSSLSACAPQGEESSAPRTPRRKVTADSEILLAGAADGSPTAKVLRRLPGRLITVVQDRPPVHRRSRGRGPRPLAEHGARSPHTSEPQSPMHGLLSDENSDAGSPPPKRKRGRPPKTRAEQSTTGVFHDLSQVVSSPELSNSPTGTRMPGSPSSRLNSESESGSPTEKRRRGRPPKRRESVVTASPSIHPPSDTTEDNLPSYTSNRRGVKVDPELVIPVCDPAADPVIPSVASDIPWVGICKEGAGSSSGVDDLASPPKRKRGRPPKSQAMSKSLSSPSLHNERLESSPERSSSPQTTRTPFRRKKPSKSVTLEEQRLSSRPPDTDDSSGGEDVPVRTPFTRSARTRLHPDQALAPLDTTPASVLASKLPRGRSLRAAPVSEKPSGTKRKPVSISSPSPPSSPHASSSERQVTGARKRLCPPAERILRSSLTANPASNTRSSRPVPPLPNSPNSHRGRKAKT